MEKRRPRRRTRNYDLPDLEHDLTRTELERAGRDVQLEVMRTWFHQSFEDPVENTPYESAEGGYIFIWGGPYDPHDELSDEFGGVVPDDVIDELAESLFAIAPEWTGHSDDYVDDYMVDSLASFTAHHEAFQTSIDSVEGLLAITAVRLTCRVLAASNSCAIS